MEKIIFAIISLSTILFAQNTAMNFLEIPATARQDATAVSSLFYDELGCIFSNPAVLKNIKDRQVCVTHNEMFQQTKSNFIGYVLPTEKYVFSVGVLGIYSTSIEGRSGQKDFDPEYVNIYQITSPEFYYDVYSVATGFGISKKIRSNINVGLTGKFLYEKIESVSGYSFATDIGAQVIKNNLWFNIAVQNFGFPVRYTERWWLLPTKLLAGVGYKYKNMNMYSELNYLLFNTKNVSIAIGVEPSFFDSLIFLRLGYKYKPYGWYLEGQHSGFSCGLGINFFGTKLDYSVSSYGILGFFHKITLGVEIDKIGNFYKLFREKIFGKKEVVKIEEEEKVEKEIKEGLLLIPEVEQITEPVIEEKLIQETQEYKETKVLTIKTDLKFVDSINKIFVYELLYLLSVELTENISIKELKIDVISREVLPSEINYNVYVSTQEVQQQIVKQIDFSKNLYGLNIRNFELQIVSNNADLTFFNFKDNEYKEILCEKLIEDEQNVVYKISLVEIPCLIIFEKTK